MSSSQLIQNVLVIEDNPACRDLMLLAFEENQIPHHLHFVRTAEEALLCLRQQQPYADVPLPQLIFLALDLPGMHGYEFLNWLKQDLHLQCIPVIVLTNSGQPEEIFTSYRLQANCFLTKPYSLDDFFTLVQKSVHFWLDFPLVSPECGLSD